MEILAEIIEGLTYSPTTPNLAGIKLKNLDTNTCPSSCFVEHGQYRFGLSKWVSPKRTRSYPYERVYNTLGFSKRVTVIPIIKDEGKAGDRDYLQWDTVSLMSLLDVYVVLAYYPKADKHLTRENKITNQKFDNEYVRKKLTEIGEYHSSALHWNMKEITESLPPLVGKIKKFYDCISKKLGVELHDSKGIDNFQKKISQSMSAFKESSREKAKQAQQREFVTTQPKEVLTSDTKAKITITNYLGGCYYFTTDEIEVKDKQLYLIEAKHTKREKLPSLGDIKDGLLKMMLYSSLENVTIQGEKYDPVPVLKLTSENITGKITSGSSPKKVESFLSKNQFSTNLISTVNVVLQEGLDNNVIIRIEGV